MRRCCKHILLVALFVLGAAYAVYPRHPSLSAFDPVAMARAETAMWRDYYEKRYPALFLELYRVAREQQGFSPFDAVRVSFLAARAAYRFQPTRSRGEAQVAMPDLTAYYRVLAIATPARFDPAVAAAVELDWWQARRERVEPEKYGLTIAIASGLLYGFESEELRRAGTLRAQAMTYRDTHGSDMTEADWDEIAHRLTTSYTLLKRAIASHPR